MIDPDGEGGQKPFKVWCDMDSDQSTGITVVEHQYEVGLLMVNYIVNGCFKGSY